MALAERVSPPCTGNLATMASAGVRRSRPPKGASTVPAPMVQSNFSASPRWLQASRSPQGREPARRQVRRAPRRGRAKGVAPGSGAAMRTWRELGGAVGVQEGPVEVGDGPAPPGHAQAAAPR